MYTSYWYLNMGGLEVLSCLINHIYMFILTHDSYYSAPPLLTNHKQLPTIVQIYKLIITYYCQKQQIIGMIYDIR